MTLNPFTRLKNVLGVAVDWRVRDILEAERDATIEMGRTFVDGAARLTDAQRAIEERVRILEERVADLESRNL